MKILLTSIGTRGDIEPFLAIGQILYKRGHEVVFSFPTQFSNLIPQDCRFHPLSSKIIELIESKEGRIVMGKAKVFDKIKALRYLYKEGIKVNRDLIEEQYNAIEEEQPDIIIHNVKCNYPLLWSMKNNKKTFLVSPVPYFIYYVKNNSHIGFNKNFGNFINKLTYRISNFGLIKTIYDAQKNISEKFSFSKKQIRANLFEKDLIYTISTSLFERPNYWKENVQVLGYQERDKTTNWKPERDVINFLERNHKVVFLTFGSMMNSSPEETSELIYNELNKLKIPTIINLASGGLIEIKDFKQNENFLFVNQIPYEWIFDKVYGVIHHGGSGTTHTALKYGCASLIIPHIIDQFGWNNLISELGAGPKGISINKLEANKMNKLISDLYTQKNFKLKAIEISQKMKDEQQLEEKLYEYIMRKTGYSKI